MENVKISAINQHANPRDHIVVVVVEIGISRLGLVEILGSIELPFVNRNLVQLHTTRRSQSGYLRDLEQGLGHLFLWEKTNQQVN